MSFRQFVLAVIFTASFVGLVDSSENNYEKLVQRMSELEKKVDQVQILESRVAKLTLLQTRSNRKHELLETRINELQRQVINNERTIETQQAEIKRLQNDNTDKFGEKTTDDNVWQDQPLEKQSSTRAIKKYSGGRMRRSFPETPFAFSAVLGNNVDHVGIEKTVLFNTVLLNDGNAYNNRTGVFTVPKEGVYMFYLAFSAGIEPHKVWMHIVVDGAWKVAGVADSISPGHDAQGTNFVVLHLRKGDSVWVSTFAIADVKIFGASGFTTFSGVLLYEY